MIKSRLSQQPPQKSIANTTSLDVTAAHSSYESGLTAREVFK